MSLAGRRVVVTRSTEQASEFSASLAARGAAVIELPALVIAPPADPGAIEQALRSLDRFDGLIVTSQNAAEALLGRAPASAFSIPVWAVGEKTAARLRSAGLPEVRTPPVFHSEALLEALGALPGQRFLIAGAPEGRETLADGLRAAGATHQALECYRRGPAPAPSLALRTAVEAAEVFTFFSGRTLRFFLEHFAPSLLATKVVAVIGPVAAAEAAELGVRVDLVPAVATAEALVEALDAFFVAAMSRRLSGALAPPAAFCDPLGMEFPVSRMRRLRRTPALRRMVRETRLSPDDFIQPLFVISGKEVRPISSMPGVSQLSVDAAVEAAGRAKEAGVPGVILFGLPDRKDSEGSESWKENGIVQRATRAIKKAVPDLCVIADLCFCEYTDHGHCGVVVDGDVDNDQTLENLGKQAVTLANAGVDVIAPSGMMDGAVLAIREALDEHDFNGVPILSYAVKYASAFYGPFREAADSAPTFGDRRTYQMDPGNAREAIREAQLDVDEGADMLMVKPALAYLDVLSELRETFELPIAAYNVSGEYAMVEAAVQNGWLERERTVLELLLGIKRAGADMILTYWATEAARWLHR